MCTANPIGNLDPVVTGALGQQWTQGAARRGGPGFDIQAAMNAPRPEPPAAPPAPAPAPTPTPAPMAVAAPVAQMQTPVPAPTGPSQGAAYMVSTAPTPMAGGQTTGTPAQGRRRRTDSLRVAPAAVATGAGTGLNIGV